VVIASSDERVAEIWRLWRSNDPRDQAGIEQALRDAYACIESRRTTKFCDCFACTVAKTLKSAGINIWQVVKLNG